MPRYHAVVRTSPKGPGSPFIGTCIQCGKQGLAADAALEICENPRALTQDDSLLEVLQWAEPTDKPTN